MTMQRRRRQWVTFEESNGLALTNVNSPLFAIPDILTNLGADNDYGGHTISRIIAHVSVASAAESTPSATSGIFYSGISVIPFRLSTASAADANIPDPGVEAAYETNWWWRSATPRLFSDPLTQPASLQWPYHPATFSTIPIDIRSSRKLQAGQVASLVVAQTGWTSTHEPTVYVWGRALVLLP